MPVVHFKMCDDDHDQIVHRHGSGCPVCRANKKIDELRNKIYDLEEASRLLEDSIFSDNYE